MGRFELGYSARGPYYPLDGFPRKQEYSLTPLLDSCRTGPLHTLMSSLIKDPSGMVLFTGSLLTGHIGNPTSPYFGQSIEHTPTREDLDIAIVDNSLFVKLPKTEWVPQEKIPPSLKDQLSYPISHPGGPTHIKKIYRKDPKRYGELILFFEELVRMGYIPEVQIFRSLKPIFEFGLPFNVLHYGSEVNEERILQKYFKS